MTAHTNSSIEFFARLEPALIGYVASNFSIREFVAVHEAFTSSSVFREAWLKRIRPVLRDTWSVIEGRGALRWVLNRGMINLRAWDVQESCENIITIEDVQITPKQQEYIEAKRISGQSNPLLPPLSLSVQTAESNRRQFMTRHLIKKYFCINQKIVLIGSGCYLLDGRGLIGMYVKPLYKACIGHDEDNISNYVTFNLFTDILGMPFITSHNIVFKKIEQMQNRKLHKTLEYCNVLCELDECIEKIDLLSDIDIGIGLSTITHLTFCCGNEMSNVSQYTFNPMDNNAFSQNYLQTSREQCLAKYTDDIYLHKLVFVNVNDESAITIKMTKMMVLEHPGTVAKKHHQHFPTDTTIDANETVRAIMRALGGDNQVDIKYKTTFIYVPNVVQMRELIQDSISSDTMELENLELSLIGLQKCTFFTSMNDVEKYRATVEE